MRNSAKARRSGSRSRPEPTETGGDQLPASTSSRTAPGNGASRARSAASAGRPPADNPLSSQKNAGRRGAAAKKDRVIYLQTKNKQSSPPPPPAPDKIARRVDHHTPP